MGHSLRQYCRTQYGTVQYGMWYCTVHAAARTGYEIWRSSIMMMGCNHSIKCLLQQQDADPTHRTNETTNERTKKRAKRTNERASERMNKLNNCRVLASIQTKKRVYYLCLLWMQRVLDWKVLCDGGRQRTTRVECEERSQKWSEFGDMYAYKPEIPIRKYSRSYIIHSYSTTPLILVVLLYLHSCISTC